MIRARLQGALNWTTGETVAVKQIQLANIPKADLGEIMVKSQSSFRTTYIANHTILVLLAQSEIDLLKNLNVGTRLL